jgi:ankyrin repeat protein
MVSSCVGLVTVDEKSSIIRLVHYTAQEYLERTQPDWLRQGRIEITKTCLTLLSFSTFDNGCCSSKKDFGSRLRVHPSYEYAARNWGYHIIADHADGPLNDPALGFLRQKAKVEASFQTLLAMRGYASSYIIQEGPNRRDGLHLAAYFGIEYAVKALLPCGEALNLVDIEGRTLLSWAAQQGHATIVKFFLNSGASLDSRDNTLFTPLAYASEGGSLAVFKILLDAGAEADATDQYGRTPLALAAVRGHTAVLDHLLDTNKIKIDAKSTHDVTALMRAAIHGREPAIRLLISRGANTELKDWGGKTAAARAAKKAIVTTLKTLLEMAAWVDCRDLQSKTLST